MAKSASILVKGTTRTTANMRKWMLVTCGEVNANMPLPLECEDGEIRTCNLKIKARSNAYDCPVDPETFVTALKALGAFKINLGIPKEAEDTALKIGLKGRMAAFDLGLFVEAYLADQLDASEEDIAESAKEAKKDAGLKEEAK
jgi:hypothetical protein